MNINKINKEELGKILTPEKIYKLKFKEELDKLYEKLYFDNVHYFLITNFFFLSILITLIIYVYIYPTLYIQFNAYLTSGFIWKFIVIFISWFILNLIIYYSVILVYFFYHDSKFKKNEKEIERDLPEFIDNLVSNLKGGISLEKALLKSVRKEQKALLSEVTLINEKIMMGKGIDVALKEFRDRFSSPILNRTLFLIDEGLKGGGNLAAPLERISENLKRIYELDEEIKANSVGFAVVIRVITLIVAPLLFALALTLLTFIGNLFSLLAKSGTQTITVTHIPPEFSAYLKVFSIAMIAMITFFSSLITSQLKGEKTYESLKYLPIYIIIALVLYKLFSTLLLSFFGNII